MRPTLKQKTAIMAMIAIVLSCGTVNAQRWHRHCRPYRVVVVSKPAVAVRVDNRFSQGERFKMAMAYLEENDYLTVKAYAKMTGLPKASAKAELDAFAADKDRPVEAVARGRKKVYVLGK